MKVDNFLSSATALKADDLQGKEVRKTMESVTEREFPEGNKLELSFDGTDRTLILNKTNLATIVAAYGGETADWSGHVLALFPTTVMFEGRQVAGIRVRVPELETKDGDADQPF